MPNEISIVAEVTPYPIPRAPSIYCAKNPTSIRIRKGMSNMRFILSPLVKVYVASCLEVISASFVLR